MKRRIIDCVANNTRSKKPRILPPFDYSRRAYWVSATETKNFMRNDHLIDVLKIQRYKSKSNRNGNSFQNFIMKRGQQFENSLVGIINKNLPITFVSDRITPQSCKRTIQLMNEGVPAIHSAPFQDKFRKTRGIIDLLVRSDYIDKLVKENPLSVALHKHPAPKLNGNYHYIVIDIKFSTLPLRADGIHLLNKDFYPAYKAQLLSYTLAIGKLQGYTSRYAYILGRRWSYKKRGENFSGIRCLDRLGVIDYLGVDKKYIKLENDAIKWVKNVKKYGKGWTIMPPSKPELYPNMCIDSGEWNEDKEKIAEEIGDITTIWYCGIKQRNKALESGINSWRDLRCNSETMGINGSRADTIDRIIRVNQQNFHKLLPNVITNNKYNWKLPCNEMFIDFETFVDVFASFDNLPEQPRTDGIFMIGVYYNNGEKWIYKNFIASSVSREAEMQMMDDFIRFVREQNNPKLWYWHAEKSLWSRAENRHTDLACEQGAGPIVDYIVDNWKLDNQWADLADVFRSEPIVIKDCFNFGLKSVAKAMRKHGMINAKIESNCHSGMDAGVNAWKAYQDCEQPQNHKVIKDIGKYNLFDVKVLYEILTYLRQQHS